jgi:hypothetical protein
MLPDRRGGWAARLSVVRRRRPTEILPGTAFEALYVDTRCYHRDRYAWTESFKTAGIIGASVWGVRVGKWYGFNLVHGEHPRWLPIGHIQMGVFS